ncbi:MAG: IS200/IS605 family element transposase accessory protein TnpB [Nanoarchaeota archaeon]|nr:IS200/IS605 family element transposase accessory protein TnpB [Nanoarchaeota archaeon]
MLKSYKFRLYPNKKQEELIRKHIGCCRFIYNYSLVKKIESYEKEKKTLSHYDLNGLLPELKKEFEWLKEVNSQSLQQENNHLDNAFKRFFREKKGFPNFKSKKNEKKSFSIPQSCEVNFKSGRISLPKLGEIKSVLHRTFKGKIKNTTVSMTPTNKYFISILVDDGKKLPKQKKFNFKNTVGIDVGITHFAMLSNGEKIENPKYLKNSLERLKILQRRTSKKQKGSANRRKANLKVSKLHEKIANQRNDFLHKFTHKIVSENQAVAIESLNITGMIRNHNLAQAISDAGWSECFRQIEYKCEWTGKTLLQIGQFEASSKICNICGEVNHNLTLADREWTCAKCETKHDRDWNAAINIKKFALQKQNLIGNAPKELRVVPLEMPTGVGSEKEEAHRL